MDLCGTITVGGILAFLLLICIIAVIYELTLLIRGEATDEGLPAGIAIGLISAVGLVFVIMGHVDYEKDYKAEYHTLVNEIVSLDRDSVTNGHFCLGCGYIETKPVYYYYYKVAENTYTLGSLKKENNGIYIVETNSYAPSIYKVKEANVDPDRYYYNIYVPFGTVVVNYSV